jgi:hypothetical protein
MILRARHIIAVGILASLTCIAYLQLLEGGAFAGDYLAPIFRYLLTTYDAKTAWLSLAVCLLAAAWNKPAPVLGLIDGMASKPLWVAFLVVIASALGSILVYHRYPLSMDEYAAVFQAKIFAAGSLTAELPPSVVDWLVWPNFNGMFLFASPQTGRAVEAYWPGFALLLAPFEFFGVPWLCNALLAGLAVYLVYLITRAIVDDRRAAGWAMLFALGSSTFLANSISFYAMQAHLTANLLFVWLLLEPTPWRALAAGLVGSLALVLHNPLPHVLFSAPWILSMATDKSRRRILPLLILGYVPGVALAVAWLRLRATILPVHDALSALSSGLAGVFTFPDSVLLNMRAASTAKLWIWAIPCLSLIALSGYLQCRARQAVRLLAQSAVLTFVGYFFVRLDQGHGWGFRYFHSAWGIIPILGGCAMSETAAPEERLVSYAGAASVLSLLILVPFQMIQIDGFISRHLAQIPSPKLPGSNVYFLTGKGGSYMADLIQIDPFLRDRNLLLASRGPDLDAELIRQNWPNAILESDGKWGQQWYLGDSDRRQTGGPTTGDEHFAPSFNPVGVHTP